MSNRLRDDHGTTVTELMVVSVLMLIVLGIIYSVFFTAGAIADSSAAHTAAADESRQAMDRVTRELRQARENVEGAGAVCVAEPRRCQFYIDLNRCGRPERVTYWIADNALYRSEAQPTNFQPPFTFSADSAAKVIVRKVKPDWTGAVFVYYTNANPPVATTILANISAVKVEVVNQASAGTKTVSVDADTWVKIRSVQNVVN